MAGHGVPGGHPAFRGITLDYPRFLSDAMLANFRDETVSFSGADLLTGARVSAGQTVVLAPRGVAVYR